MAAIDKPERADKILPEHLLEKHLSIAVFGPGKGEAIVVRLPDGQVGVIDGCRADDDPVLELVQALAPKRLAFVALTHPHEDHFLGLDVILAKYGGRIDNVWETGALSGRNFEAWVTWRQLTWGRDEALDDPAMGALLKSLDECLAKIYAEIGQLMRQEPNSYQTLSSNTLLMPAHDLLGADFEVCAWGPRPADLLRADEALLAWLNEQRALGKKLPDHDPNVASGAILLRWGESRILLAGDLLLDGWSLVRQNLKRVQVVNVAHHASAKAHDSVLWTGMKPELAIVTPFLHASGSQPPRPDDIRRLAATCKVAVTAPPKWLEPLDLSHPKPTSPLLPPPVVTLKSAGQTPTHRSTSREDRYNAVAVSMDAKGGIVQVVLARNARYYNP